MTLPDSTPPIPEILQPEHVDDPFKGERSLEDYFKTLRYRVIQLSDRVFTNEEEAEKAMSGHVDAINDEFFSQPEKFKMPVVITGEGISEPNVESGIPSLSDGRRAIMIAFNQDNGYIPAPSFETKTGYLEGVYGQVVSFIDDEGVPTGQHVVQIRYIVRAKYAETIEVTLEGPNIAAVRAEVYPAYLASIATVDIQSETLSKEREAEALASEMALRGITGSSFKQKVESLEESLKRSSPYEFIDLSDIDDFRSIGRLGGLIARQSPDHARTVKEVIMRALTEGRPLKIDGTSLLPRIGDEPIIVTGEMKGEVFDILLPESEDDPTIPSIILNCDVETEEGSATLTKSMLYIFDFEQINAVKF